MKTAPLFRALLAAAFPAALAAQSVHWDPPGGSLPVGQTTALQLVYDGCEPKSQPSVPNVDGLTIEYSGQSSSMSFDNGNYSRTISTTYAALLSDKRPIDIPSFTVETDKGTLRVPAAHFDPGTATVGGGRPLETAANSHLDVGSPEVWAGEVFNLGYAIEADRGYYPDFGHGDLSWDSKPLVAEDWSAPQAFDDSSGSEPRTGLAYRARAIVRTPGSYRLNPVNQLVRLSVGVTGFGFFQQRSYQQFSVTSTTPAVEVRPLPPAPQGFSGAVGEFKLSSKVVPQNPSVGDPVTWTLELSGTGNWPDIQGLPTRKVSSDFQVIQPRAKRTADNGKLFDAKLSEDAILVPTKPGSYDLDPVRFIYFDPKSGKYRTIETAPVTVIATAAATTAQAPQAAATAAATSAAPAAPPGAPPTPSGLPKDPLPDAEPAPGPLSWVALAGACVAPFVLIAVLWLWLARRRARLTDPARARRAARARLAATLSKLQTGGENRPVSDLLAWQRDSAAFWQAGKAVPTAGSVSDPAWAALWSEADRVVYGPDPSLPADWIARARDALAKAGIPAFAAARMFSPGNLFPFFLLALFLCAAGPSATADAPTGFPHLPPGASYRMGDFAAAESGWRSAVAKEPTAWSSRYDLSLALSQQDHWDEAAAQAAAAFVQQPGSPDVRWQFSLASVKAGFVPEPLADFLDPGPRQWLARLASPAGWRLALAGAAWLFAAALALLLAAGYGIVSGRGVAPAAVTAIVVALLLAGASALGWTAYGIAADSNAVVVWRSSSLRSVPTEADTAQSTVPLPAGSTARADKRFLGWLRLNFDNGQTGWVRADEVVWLWK